MVGLDEIAIRESNMKIHFFNPKGDWLKTTEISSSVPLLGRAALSPLGNGGYLIQYPRLGEGGEVQGISIGVLDGRFQKTRDLVTFNLPGSIEKISNPFIPVPVFCHSREAIFFGYETAGQDISVFGLNGQLIRMIRKRYPPVPIPASFRGDLLKRMRRVIPFGRTSSCLRTFRRFNSS